MDGTERLLLQKKVVQGFCNQYRSSLQFEKFTIFIAPQNITRSPVPDPDLAKLCRQNHTGRTWKGDERQRDGFRNLVGSASSTSTPQENTMRMLDYGTHGGDSDPEAVVCAGYVSSKCMSALPRFAMPREVKSTSRVSLLLPSILCERAQSDRKSVV